MIYFVQAEIVGHVKIGLHGGDDARERMADLVRYHGEEPERS